MFEAKVTNLFSVSRHNPLIDYILVGFILSFWIFFWLSSNSAFAFKEKDADPNLQAQGTLLNENSSDLIGDPVYGEYLSSECVTCHSVSGLDNGIPSIIGRPKEQLIHALNAYKSGLRKHEIMQILTKRLSDEEIAALAAYFGSIEPVEEN